MISRLISQFKKYGHGGLILAVAAIILFSGLIVPEMAAAAHVPKGCSWYDLMCHGVHLFIWGIQQVGYIIAYIAGFFISFFAAVIQGLIGASAKLTQLDFVKKGFGLTLSLTNLGFVLAIIVIAFATILRLQNYAMKQLLWKLVVAALLVNFSFAIAGIILDFTNILGDFFLEGASPNGEIKRFGDNLANTFNIQKLAQPELGKLQARGGGVGLAAEFAPVINSIASLVAMAIFSTVLAITFAAVAFMLLVRLVYLIVLLILMPIVWLFWIFPGLSKHWSDWWSKFIQWNFFYPAMMFFIYLSVKNPITGGFSASDNGAATAAESFLAFGDGVVSVYMQILVRIGILFGGLLAAQKMGITGANAFMNAAKGSARWIAGAPVRGAGALGLRPTKAAAGGLATLLSKPGLRWIPGAKGAAAGLAGFASRKTEIEDYQKNYLANLTKEQFQNVAKTSPVGPVAKAAILAEATKRKDVGALTAEIDSKLARGTITKEEAEKQKGARLELFSKAANTTNPDLVKDLLATNPKYAKLLSGGKLSIKEVMGKMPANKASEIATDSLEDPEVVEALSGAMLSNIQRDGSGEKKEAIKRILEKAAGISDANRAGIEGYNQNIANILKEVAQAKREGDTALVKAKRSELKIVREAFERSIYKPTDEQRPAYEKLQTLEQRIGNPNIT